MKKSTALYALYGAAVLAVGSVFMYFSRSAQRPEKGTVSAVLYVTATAENSTTVTSKAAKTTKSTAPHTTKTTKTTSTKVTTTETVTEAAPTEPEILWLDINEADEAELAKLPNIGEKLAAEIVAYRNAYGRFRNIEELMNVSGIGEGRLADIREFIYVVDPVYDEPAEETVQEDTPEPQTETEHIPTLEEAAPIDLNTAEKEALMLLPHVDEDIAQRILDFREQAGHFSHPYELLYIEWLTQENVAEIIEYVKVDEN